MEPIQFIQVDPSQLQSAIVEGVKTELKKIRQLFEEQKSKKVLTRKEVKETLGVSYVTLNKWNKNGTLKAVGIGGSVFYRQSEIDEKLRQI